MKKLLFMTFMVAFTQNSIAQMNLNCVNSKVAHSSLRLELTDDGLIYIQKFQDGKALTQPQIARHLGADSDVKAQYVIVGKGQIEYMNLAPGALNPKLPSKKTGLVLGAQLENFYHCIKN